ncbi:MAG: 50S ribosomal protein L11 methyltransferase [Opitutae bacterium]
MPEILYKSSSDIPADQTDFVEGFLFEHAPSKWALEVNYNTGDGLLHGFFASKEEMLVQESAISQEIGNLIKFRFKNTEIHDQDWKESYKAHFTPWQYKFFHLIPLWLKDTYRVSTDELALFLDPGMAFGTGNHETTRMCLEFLIDQKKSHRKSKSLLDLGCGSGILSLTACLLGYENVLGIDNDQDAVRISEENAVLNNLAQKLRLKTSNLFDLEQSLGTFDCVIANIQADILIACAGKIFEHTHNGSSIILSGILTREIDQVLEACKEATIGNHLAYRLKELGEWTSVQFHKS